MASDADWVEDVKRWYFAGQREANGMPVTAAPASSLDETFGYDASGETLGYEAADPRLQARYWPDAPSAVGEPTRPG